jgi:hypothetical protein
MKMEESLLMNRAFQFVMDTCTKYNIDESHGLKHSMDVLQLANKIFIIELTNNPFLEDQKMVIFISCIIHDMCDKKYMSETTGILEIKSYFGEYMSEERLDMVLKIISTMSYSKVKEVGYPELHEYQLAYHIVRESDLLASYDMDRCIIYGMMVKSMSYTDAIIRGKQLMESRVLKYISDDLFITDYARDLATKLHTLAMQDLTKYDF